MRLREIDALKLYHSWTYESQYFEPFIRTGPFTTMKHYEDFELTGIDVKENDLYKDIVNIIEEHNLKETLLILDLPDGEGIKQGMWLNNNKQLKPIPVFNFLLNNFGLVGSKEFVNDLVCCGFALDKVKPEGFVFILEYNRFGEFSEKQYEEGFNNQYEISDENVPDYEMLTALKYKRVVYMSLGPVKEDIEYYFQYLEENDINVSKYNLKRDL